MIRALDVVRGWLGPERASDTISGYESLQEALLGASTAAGVVMTPATAMRISTVHASVRILSEGVAGLPLIVYERIDRGKRRAVEHPLYRILHDRPNPDQTSVQWRSIMQSDVELHGNAYALKVRIGGQVRELHHIEANRVKAARDSSGRVVYTVRSRGVQRTELVETMRSDRIFHVAGPFGDGICGASTVHEHRELFGLAFALGAFLSHSLKNGVRLSGVLQKEDGTLPDKAYERLRDWVRDEYEGVANASRLLILEEGLKYQSTAQTMHEAQIAQLATGVVADIARVFQVPLHMLASNIQQPRANMEQQAREFVDSTLRGRVTRWEQRVTADLLEDDPRFFAEHLVDDLLRGDTKTRAEVYRHLIETGVMTPNEARERENMNPLPGLDVPRPALNAAPLIPSGAQPTDDG